MSRDSTDGDLRDYDETEYRKPILHKDAHITARLPEKGNVVVGYRGPIPARRSYGYVSFRQRAEHYHRKEAGYAISEKVLRKLRTLGCRTVLIAETDTQVVYEWHESDFTRTMPKKHNPLHDEDPQKVVTCESHRGKWHHHADTVMTGDRVPGG